MNFETILNAPWISQACAGFICGFVFLFFLHFGLRSRSRRRALDEIIAGLKGLGENAEPGPLFKNHPELEHLWQEFGETLLEQTEFNSATGEYEVVRKRATVPAEQYFSTQAVVDSYVWAEFYKHLPGILTGIGIIGTFFGILHGLEAFNISDNADLVRKSLGGLLSSVSEAFLVSAFAIFFAMLITVVEKALLARMYKKAEELVVEVDKRYKAGVGEAMLQDLVHSTKEYVSNSQTLKDSLVTDLKGILTTLSESQIQAQKSIIEEQIRAHNQSSEELGRQIGQHLSEGLKAALEEPMKAVQEAVQSATGDRTGAVHTLLTEVVQGLNQSLKDLFGDQIAGINTMQQQTTSALQTAVARMEQMSSALETAGTRATDTMAAKLGEAITGMEARQEMMTRQMAQIVEEMKASVANSQNETNNSLQEALSGVSTTIESLISTLSRSVATSQDATNEKLQSALTGVTQTVEALVATLSQSVATSQSETNGKLQSALTGVTQTVETLVATLSQSVATSQSETNGKLQETLSNVSAVVEKLVTSLSQSVAQSQAESNSRLQDAVSTVSQNVTSLVSGMSEQAAKADAAHIERQSQLAAQAETAAAGMRSAVENLTVEMKALVSGTRTAVETMRASVDSMRAATSDTVTRLNSGAETMYVASSEFSKAGNAVTGVLQQATSATDKLAAAAGTVGTASQTLQSVVNDYRTTRDQLVSTLAELASIVDYAKTHASLTGDVLSQISNATKGLNKAQLDVEQFMGGVSEVLGSSAKEFQNRLTETMNLANRELIDSTGKVTGLLGRTIQQLAIATRPVVAEGA